MSNTILIIAHAPLATALRQCVMHVYSGAGAAEVESVLTAFDVPADQSLDETLAAVRRVMNLSPVQSTLVLTDLFGATPCNIAQKLVEGLPARVVAGVNLPMLLRAVTYWREPLDVLVTRTMAGGTQGVMQVANVPPQNQARKKNDQDNNDHQQ
ncbi:MAG: PTS fructose transporter subunit IIA [Burkholderiaceae bacterium]